MKSLNKYKQIIITLAVLLCISSNISAQTDSTFFYNPFFELYNAWISTDNAAGYQFFKHSDFTEVKASYYNGAGDFKSEFSSDRMNSFSIDVLGYRKIKGVSYYGAIFFESKKNKARKWSYLTNRNSGSPYIIGDSIVGDFKFERFRLFGAMSGELFTENIKYGLSVNYLTSIGAKNKDPRSLNHYMDLRFCPSLIFQLSNSFRLGIASGYLYKREAIEIKYFSDNKENLFYFKGLGFISSFLSLNEVNRKYLTEDKSVSVQAQYEIDNFMSLWDIKFSYLEEEVEDGYSVIKPEFYYEKETVEVSSLSKLVVGDYVSKIKLDFDYKDGVGIVNVLKSKAVEGSYEWVKLGENRDYRNSNIDARFEYLLKKSRNYVGIDCAYNKSNEKYYFSPSTFYNRYENFVLGVQMSAAIEINKSRLSFSSHLSTRFNTCKESYLLDDVNSVGLNISNTSNFIMSDVIDNEFVYSTADYFKYSFSIKYDVPVILAREQIESYIVIDYTGINADRSLENHYISLSLGLKL